MSTNPISTNPTSGNSSPNPVTTSQVAQIVGTVTGVVGAIEQIVAASGLVGSLNMGQIEQVTALLGNLAGVAIQAVHDVSGVAITPDSVLALLPVAAALTTPPRAEPARVGDPVTTPTQAEPARVGDPVTAPEAEPGS